MASRPFRPVNALASLLEHTAMCVKQWEMTHVSAKENVGGCYYTTAIAKLNYSGCKSSITKTKYTALHSLAILVCWTFRFGSLVKVFLNWDILRAPLFCTEQ